MTSVRLLTLDRSWPLADWWPPLATEVDCRLWESSWVKQSEGSRAFTFGCGDEGTLQDKWAQTDAEQKANIRHLRESARRIDVATNAGQRCWVHCQMGKNRGPAGCIAFLLLHTPVASLAEAFGLVHDSRQQAKTAQNTFVRELQTICLEAGKPLE